MHFLSLSSFYPSRLLSPVPPGARQLRQHWLWDPLLLCGLVRVWGLHPREVVTTGRAPWKLTLPCPLDEPELGAMNGGRKTVSQAPLPRCQQATRWTLDIRGVFGLDLSPTSWPGPLAGFNVAVHFASPHVLLVMAPLRDDRNLWLQGRPAKSGIPHTLGTTFGPLVSPGNSRSWPHGMLHALSFLAGLRPA